MTDFDSDVMGGLKSQGLKSLTQSLIIADLSRSGVSAVLLAVAAGEQLVEVARATAAAVDTVCR